jgi:hypothetical protein|tara:strand:- start:83 stop:622 length:540 start_codon:yes stop_codon:yes gene_type:complete
MFDKDQKNLQLLLTERILTPPPSDGDRWERNQFSPEEEDKYLDAAGDIDRDGWGEKLLTSAGNHGVGSPEVKSHIADIGKAGAFLQVKKFLQYVKNTPSKYDQHIRDAAEALIITYKFDEEEETTGHKPEFKKNTPSSWEEYKKRLMWGSDMDPKQLKNLSPEERKKRIDKFFKSPHYK